MKFFSLLLVTLLFPPYLFAETGRSAVFYYSAPEQAENTNWKYEHVGLGAQAQLKQSLLENVMDIALVDEKLLATPDSGEIIILKEKNISPALLHQQAVRFNVEYIYWVRILDFLKPKKQVHIALFSFGSAGTEIKLEVCRYTLTKEEISCFAAEAESSKEQTAFIYKPVEGEAFAKDFNQTEAGKLTATAILNAINTMNE